MEKQQTLAKQVRLSGIALHTGIRATLNLLPADENTGIVFRRVDMEGKPEVRAFVTNVVDVQRELEVDQMREVRLDLAAQILHAPYEVAAALRPQAEIVQRLEIDDVRPVYGSFLH